MKYKVGDRVKVIKCETEGSNCSNYGKIGKIINICEYHHPYTLDIDTAERWCDKELELVPQEFTKSDLKDGDIVTYRDKHKAVVANGQSKLRSINEDGLMYLADYDENLEYKTGGHNRTINDIIKVERPIKYETVFERKEEILDEAEKRYLGGVIRPWRDEVEDIYKFESGNDANLFITVKGDIIRSSLPIFDKNSMYKNMKANKRYTLEELRIIRSIRIWELKKISC